MWILGKHISTLTEANLSELVQGGVGESQTLDYKSAFALNSDDEKASLLADVTAMANTSGGVILFGVETQRDANGRDTGIPIALPGLAGLNFDGERQKIESILRTAASPSLTTQIAVKDISLAAGTIVLALGVSRSYLAPHRIGFKGKNRFYRRGQGENYQPEVSRYYLSMDHVIDAASVVLPTIVVDDPEAFGSEAIDTAIDVLWQSAGHSEVPRPKKA